MRLKVIAIVGRPNVGKSSLLNALAGRRISIVQDQPGVTRDRISTPLDVDGRFVELIDTGGYGFHDEQGLTEHIRHQIEHAMARADLVLFIVDAQEGLTAADQEVATLLRRKGIKSVFVANKADGPKADLNLADFARVGLGTPIGVSALTGRNVDAIRDAIRKNVDLSDAPTKLPPAEMFVAIVGKRNAGKSTLVNAIAKLFDERDEDRVIVSEVPGTTRDSIDVRFEKEGKTLVVIDTAGVRKKRHMVGGANDIEFYSFHRAQRSIRRADAVMMLIDGAEHISEPDKKLAQYIAEQYKPVVLVVNKWDLVLDKARAEAESRGAGFSDQLLMDEFSEYLNQELRHLDYAPVAFITAKDGRKVQAVVDLAQHLNNQAKERVTTGRLNRAVKQIFEERAPSTPRGQRVKVFYATQIDTDPPTIALIVNNPDWVHEDYKRFMINRFRELLPYAEVPIKLLIRPRGAGDKSGAADEALVDTRRRHESGRASASRRASSTRGEASRGKSARGKASRRPAPAQTRTGRRRGRGG